MNATPENVMPDDFDPSKIIMPGHFAGPHEMPVHVDVIGAYDDRGQWWVIMRTETVHGSFIAFLTPAVAASVQDDLQAARKAGATTPFVPPAAHN